jgi:hypothetical protein
LFSILSEVVYNFQQPSYHVVTILLILWNENHLPLSKEMMQMYMLKEKFEKERCSKSKQTTLTDLFKRAVASSNPSLSADSVTRNPDNK